MNLCRVLMIVATLASCGPPSGPTVYSVVRWELRIEGICQDVQEDLTIVLGDERFSLSPMLELASDGSELRAKAVVFMKTHLVGKHVLASTTGGVTTWQSSAPRDSRGRIHAYFKVNSSRNWIEKLLVKEGLARLRTPDPGMPYSWNDADRLDQLGPIKDLERSAQSASSGIWASHK